MGCVSLSPLVSRQRAAATLVLGRRRRATMETSATDISARFADSKDLQEDVENLAERSAELVRLSVDKTLAGIRQPDKFKLPDAQHSFERRLRAKFDALSPKIRDPLID